MEDSKKLQVIEGRIKEQEQQVWKAKVEQSGSLRGYSQVKESLGEEFYLKLGLGKRELKHWIQLRSSNLPLGYNLKKLEWHGPGPDCGYSCPLCKNENEDFVHFLQCSITDNIRPRFLREVRFPDILQSKRKENIVNTSRFLGKALQLRKEYK